jgi:hypothetical protein
MTPFQELRLWMGDGPVGERLLGAGARSDPDPRPRTPRKKELR